VTGGTEARRRLVLRDSAGYSRALTDRQLDMAASVPAPEWRHSPTLPCALMRFAALACVTVMQREEPLGQRTRIHVDGQERPYEDAGDKLTVERSTHAGGPPGLRVGEPPKPLVLSAS